MDIGDVLQKTIDEIDEELSSLNAPDRTIVWALAEGADYQLRTARLLATTAKELGEKHAYRYPELEKHPLKKGSELPLAYYMLIKYVALLEIREWESKEKASES